jgi:hypothetical protein
VNPIAYRNAERRTATGETKLSSRAITKVRTDGVVGRTSMPSSGRGECPPGAMQTNSISAWPVVRARETHEPGGWSRAPSNS